MIQRKLLAVNKAVWGFVSRLPTSPGFSAGSSKTQTHNRGGCASASPPADGDPDPRVESVQFQLTGAVPSCTS